MISSNRANFFLLLVTIIWGGTFPLIRDAVVNNSPELFIFLRFSLGALLLLPLVIKRLRYTTKAVFIGGIILAFFNMTAYLTQTIGLQTTSSANSAFITALNVVMVPLLLPLFGLGKSSRIDLLAALICLLGVFMLTGHALNQLTMGDAWTFICAIFVALTIVTLKKMGQYTHEYAVLAFYQVLFSAIFSMIFLPWQDLSINWHRNFIIGVLYCAVLATSVVFYWQTKYQQFTTAQKAAMIFSLEPVFASVFAFAFNNEPLSLNAIIGGIVILGGILLTELHPLRLKSR